ncbi:MAG: Lrp/AsnC family transcriptional regulator [Saprospiraceae bacterium]|uniref:Lrp/AsnC family transcriptional regulator n=1 Tax=Candidatus Opimibacter skivensis TaxID=2982028 RepID=A0A9D7STZ5_9BACT|nr:Lrp/AsnC family transcriptional regulator [Candidatus Opimibacter skivensis]
MNQHLENQIDSTDIRIIDALMEDGRIAYSVLAEQIGSSNTLVHQRVRKLKETGVLMKPVYLISPEHIGYDTCAFVLMMIKEANQIHDVIEALKKIPEVVSCVSIMGRYDLMARLYAVNNKHLQDIVHDKLQAIPGVEGTNTMVAFEVSFERQAIIPDTETLNVYRSNR